MKDPRAGKRRRVSDAEDVDQDGDIAMGDDSQGVGSSPSPSPTPRNRRTQEVAEPEKTDTPSRTGLRSSGRQRKPPQRFEDNLAYTPSRRSAATHGQNSVMGRSSQKASVVEQEDDDNVDNLDDEEDEDYESPAPRERRATRTRSTRTVKFDTKKTETNGHAATARETSRQSPSPDEYTDGLDDLVSMQLQQGLMPQEADPKSEPGLPGDALPAYGETFKALAQNGLTDELQTLTEVVVEKLNGKRHVPLKGLEKEHEKVYQLVEQTVTVGEGNSMLLLGSRGSGKTAIVENVISSLAREHNNDFHVVRLNGFLHVDDRLALREMWRQLGRETNTEEEAGKVTSYADTMATLLALLSHPEELDGVAGQPGTVTAAKSVVIVLDEFDLFVTHPRQTLLYNLFDIAQARKAPVAVLGLTTKVDVTEMLEKRVKSRFSHRYVFVPLPRTFDIFSDVCYAGLNLEDDEVSALKGADSGRLFVLQSPGGEKILAGWRVYLQGLWSDETFQSHLQRIYSQTKCVKEFFTSALIALGELHYSTYASSESNSTSTLPLQIPTPATFTGHSLSCPDPAPLPFEPTTTVSASPSSLPLSLLLAATRLTALYDPSLEVAGPTSMAPLALSFPAAYAEYVRLLTSAKTSASVSGAAATPGRVWGRDVAREAWEKLVGWGLISAVGGGAGTADGRMFRMEVSFEEVVEWAGSGGSLGRWWRGG